MGLLEEFVKLLNGGNVLGALVCILMITNYHFYRKCEKLHELRLKEAKETGDRLLMVSEKINETLTKIKR